MTLGNVAPAPLSCTWAAAGAAAPRTAMAMNLVSFMSSSLRVALERELHLEQGALACGVLERGRATFERQKVDVAEHPEIGRHLIGYAPDDAGLFVVANVGVGIDDVDAGDRRGLAVLELVDTEGADDTAGRLGKGCRGHGVFGRDKLGGDRDLLRLVRDHPEEAIAFATAGGLTDAGVAGKAQTAHAAVVVGGGHAHRDTR